MAAKSVSSCIPDGRPASPRRASPAPLGCAMDFKRAPDPGVDPPTEIERLPSAPFTLPSGPVFEHVWLGRAAVHGELFGGRYELGERLRAGVTGDLFLATHVAVQRHVAIQLLRPELASNSAARQRFERAALALAAID